MDENKRQKLYGIGYVIRQTCGNCVYGVSVRHSRWGTCSNFYYRHRKHTEQKRSLSITQSGWCPFWTESKWIPETWVEFSE